MGVDLIIFGHRGVINLHLSKSVGKWQRNSELQSVLTEYPRSNIEITSFAGTHGGDGAEEWDRIWRSWWNITSETVMFYIPKHRSTLHRLDSTSP